MSGYAYDYLDKNAPDEPVLNVGDKIRFAQACRECKQMAPAEAVVKNQKGKVVLAEGLILSHDDGTGNRCDGSEQSVIVRDPGPAWVQMLLEKDDE
jgi:hypothetical protein